MPVLGPLRNGESNSLHLESLFLRPAPIFMKLSEKKAYRLRDIKVDRSQYPGLASTHFWSSVTYQNSRLEWSKWGTWLSMLLDLLPDGLAILARDWRANLARHSIVALRPLDCPYPELDHRHLG